MDGTAVISQESNRANDTKSKKFLIKQNVKNETQHEDVYLKFQKMLGGNTNNNNPNNYPNNNISQRKEISNNIQYINNNFILPCDDFGSLSSMNSINIEQNKFNIDLDLSSIKHEYISNEQQSNKLSIKDHLDNMLSRPKQKDTSKSNPYSKFRQDEKEN